MPPLSPPRRTPGLSRDAHAGERRAPLRRPWRPDPGVRRGMQSPERKKGPALLPTPCRRALWHPVEQAEARPPYATGLGGRHCTGPRTVRHLALRSPHRTAMSLRTSPSIRGDHVAVVGSRRRSPRFRSMPSSSRRGPFARSRRGRGHLARPDRRLRSACTDHPRPSEQLSGFPPVSGRSAFPLQLRCCHAARVAPSAECASPAVDNVDIVERSRAPGEPFARPAVTAAGYPPGDTP